MPQELCLEVGPYKRRKFPLSQKLAPKSEYMQDDTYILNSLDKMWISS